MLGAVDTDGIKDIINVTLKRRDRNARQGIGKK